MPLKKKFWICSAITLAVLGTAASALYHNTELGHLISQKSYYDFSDGTFTTEETYKKSNLIQNPDGSSVVYEDNYGFLISSVTHTNPENVSITESLTAKSRIPIELHPIRSERFQRFMIKKEPCWFVVR